MNKDVDSVTAEKQQPAPADELPDEALADRQQPIRPLQKGERFALPPGRRIVCDLLYFDRQFRSFPIVRNCNVARTSRARAAAARRISWPILFIKAFGIVSSRMPELRRAFLRYPFPTLYEHPESVARMTIARHVDHPREPERVFFVRFFAPETTPLTAMQDEIDHAKVVPLKEHVSFSRQLLLTRFPALVRRAVWWGVLHLSGAFRTHMLGTFSLTTVSNLGAISVRPPQVNSLTLTYSPIDKDGNVRVTLVYDHRALDGAPVARALKELEHVLNEEIVAELESLTA